MRPAAWPGLRAAFPAGFMAQFPDVDYDFFECIYAPAGLNIGGETAQEIAVAIMAEMLAVIRKQEPIALKNKMGDIHG